MTRQIKVKDVTIGAEDLVLIAGPCVIQTEESTLEHARRLKEISGRLNIPLIFKSSYDKANRSSLSSYRGPGLEKGLKILGCVKEKLDLPVLSDVHCREEIVKASQVLDIIQIPAFLSRQTDFIIEAARTGKPLNIKKGQFLAPWDVKNIIDKVVSTGNKDIIVTERGTCFGYNNLVSDMRSLAIMAEFGYPVIYDATHSVQLPGGAGTSSGGQRDFVPGLSRAAVAMGCHGLFLEVHVNPDSAPCDGPNMLALEKIEELLLQVKKIHDIVKKK